MEYYATQEEIQDALFSSKLNTKLSYRENISLFIKRANNTISNIHLENELDLDKHINKSERLKMLLFDYYHYGIMLDKNTKMVPRRILEYMKKLFN